ncbi:SRPBCC domain-containing protein [Ferrovibrio sp.]|uniref:SRPBCC family protein n=1 Tax=Ferrovibrio sp. TaxID=1917215 RepID=UPI000CB73EBC|nr:SRPBCC domain-containing protein [Ferrovibrio sp.]PJI43410.1 MAG: ATPase [Ferrovibrio sp.]
MNNIAVKSDMQSTDATSIVIDEVFPHGAEVLWKAITNGDLMGRWMMKPTGFEPVVGNRFTFQTTPAGAWDGFIRCEVLEVLPLERFAFAWRGGDEGNVGYGSKLDTVVTFTLRRVQTGTRLRMEHSGFVLPKNDTAYTNMGKGWVKCVQTLSTVAAEQN